MFSVQEMQRVDRELSLELTESPINPAFIHMSAPLVNGYDPLYGGSPKPHLRQRLNETNITLDQRLAGFLNIAFYNLQSGVFFVVSPQPQAFHTRKPSDYKLRFSNRLFFMTLFSKFFYFLFS